MYRIKKTFPELNHFQILYFLARRECNDKTMRNCLEYLIVKIFQNYKTQLVIF